MPRTARASAAGFCYHVLNRGNARAEVFHKNEDFPASGCTILAIDSSFRPGGEIWDEYENHLAPEERWERKRYFSALRFDKLARAVEVFVMRG